MKFMGIAIKKECNKFYYVCQGLFWDFEGFYKARNLLDFNHWDCVVFLSDEEPFDVEDPVCLIVEPHDIAQLGRFLLIGNGLPLDLIIRKILPHERRQPIGRHLQMVLLESL